jgi:hypothetical protein
MNGRNKKFNCVLAFLLILTLISCSAVPEIRITYSVPEKSNDLSGLMVFLGFDDSRTSKNIIGENAREDYKGFPGNFTMLLTGNTDGVVKKGIYDIRTLFLKSMKSRLENQGIIIAEKEGMSDNRLIIALKEFSLDLLERKWVVKITYEAKILIDEKERAKQTISARGERLKLIDHKQADILMSDIFTDSINQLNVVNLMRDANLI